MGWTGTEMQVGKEERGRNRVHLLSHLSCVPCTLPLFSSGWAFLVKFILTTRDQEHMWVGQPGAVTTAEQRENGLVDRTALSPHLLSGKVHFSSAPGCRGETGTARDFPHGVCQPWQGGSLERVHHSTKQLPPPYPPGQMWAPLRLGAGPGEPRPPHRGFSEQLLWRLPGLPPYLPLFVLYSGFLQN